MNPRHQRFIEEYLVDLNATRAYRAAYPKVKSDETARAAGARLLANVNVAAAIGKAQAERAQKAQVTAEQVLLGLRDEAMRFGEGSTHSARVQAWGLLARHLGLFADRLHITGQVQTSAPAQ